MGKQTGKRIYVTVWPARNVYAYIRVTYIRVYTRTAAYGGQLLCCRCCRRGNEGYPLNRLNQDFHVAEIGVAVHHIEVLPNDDHGL